MSSIKIKPTKNHVLIKLLPVEEEILESGIILPAGRQQTDAQHRLERAEVLAIGPKVTELQVGDIALIIGFAKDSAIEKDTYIVNADHIEGILEAE